MAGVAMGPAGFVAVIAGWVVAEVGRQPYVVYGVLRTADAVSPVGAGQVSASLLGFMIVYAVIFSVGVLYILRLIAEGPRPEDDAPPAEAAAARQRAGRRAGRRRARHEPRPAARSGPGSSPSRCCCTCCWTASTSASASSSPSPARRPSAT